MYCLEDMYNHILKVAKIHIKKEVEITIGKAIKALRIQRESNKEQTGDFRDIAIYSFDLTTCCQNGGYTLKPQNQKVFYDDVCNIMNSPDQSKYEIYIKERVESLLQERLLASLNEEFHSPITLSAALISKKNGQNEDRVNKQTKMFNTLLQSLKMPLWTYGNNNCEIY